MCPSFGNRHRTGVALRPAHSHRPSRPAELPSQDPRRADLRRLSGALFRARIKSSPSLPYAGSAVACVATAPTPASAARDDRAGGEVMRLHGDAELARGGIARRQSSKCERSDGRWDSNCVSPASRNDCDIALANSPAGIAVQTAAESKVEALKTNPFPCSRGGPRSKRATYVPIL